MLALGTHMSNFYILREDIYDGNEYFCINIGTIHDKLAQKIRWKENNHKFDNISAINDFIFLCFIVGNDFLPHIPSIEIIDNGIELILEVYKEVCTSYGHITSINAGRVQFSTNPMKVFLNTIGGYEKENFERKLEKKHSSFPDPILNNCSTQKNDKWFVDIEKYRKNYLEECFTNDINQETLCHEYLEGMQWVLSYYTRGVPNWKWNFRHHYAPPASIIANYCDSFEFPKYGRTLPSTPFQQLLCVLPPKSADLIPKPLSGLLTNSNSPLKQYYPGNFKIDLAGKHREWEGIVILPFVDFDLVRQCYMDLLDKIDHKELKRNFCGKSFIYTYNNSSQGVFNSYYGNIQNYNVKCDIINL
jgi:5'-3' exoribonuclease 2